MILVPCSGCGSVITHYVGWYDSLFSPLSEEILDEDQVRPVLLHKAAIQRGIERLWGKSQAVKQKHKPQKATCPCCKKPRDLVAGTPLLALEDELRRQNADPLCRPVGWSFEAARAGRLQWACNQCLERGRAIRGTPAIQTFCDYEPYFAYFDVELRCEDCEKQFLFSAREQQFWYERLKFWVQSRPKQCRRARRQRLAKPPA